MAWKHQLTDLGINIVPLSSFTKKSIPTQLKRLALDAETVIAYDQKMLQSHIKSLLQSVYNGEQKSNYVLRNDKQVLHEINYSISKRFSLWALPDRQLQKYLAGSWETWLRGFKTWVQSQIQNKAQWLAASRCFTFHKKNSDLCQNE